MQYFQFTDARTGVTAANPVAITSSGYKLKTSFDIKQGLGVERISQQVTDGNAINVKGGLIDPSAAGVGWDAEPLKYP